MQGPGKCHRAGRAFVALVIMGLVVAMVAPAGADPIGPGDFEDPPILQGPRPVVKWSMPERFADSPSVGVPTGDPIDPLDQEFQDYIRPPQGWSVSLDGCLSYSPDPGRTVAEYEWTLAGPLGNIVRHVPRSDDCTSRLNGLSLGSYDLILKVWDSGGLTVSRTERIEVKDLVIAVAGDSMASGEGNPEAPGSIQGGVISQWVDDDCDRSSRSGHARAAREIEENDPHTSVTYINVACTGATTAQMLDAPWPGVLDDDRWHAPQLRHLGAALCDDDASRGIRQNTPDPLSGVETWAAFTPDCQQNESRSIHSLFLTVGVNDIGFRDVLFACGDLDFDGWGAIEDALGWHDQAVGGVFSGIWGDILSTGCDDNATTTAKVVEGMDTIRDTSAEAVFPRMDAMIASSGLVDSDSGGGIYQAVYPHHVFTEGPFDSCDGVLTRIGDDEIVYLDVVNLSLNQALRAAASRLGWYSAPLFRDDAWVGHGYCEPTGDRWFVSLTESVAQYNNEHKVVIEGETERPITFGILHPNASGHDNIRRMIMDEWVERSRPVTHTVNVDFHDIRIEDTLTYVRPESELPPFLVFDFAASRIGLDGQAARWEQIQEVVVPVSWQSIVANQWRMVPETTPLASSFEVGLNEAESMQVVVTGAFPSVSDEVECPPLPGLLAVPAAAPTDPPGGGGGGGTCTPGTSRGTVAGDNYDVADGTGFGGGATYTEEGFDPFTTDSKIFVRYSISDANAPQPPVASAGGPYVVDEGSNGGVLQLDGTGSTDPDGDDADVTYQWSGADVLPADSPTPEFDAADDASETVTLTVTDTDGLQASDTTSIDVRNVAPTVTLDGATVDEGDTVTLEGTFSDPGLLDTHSATVAWADGGADPAPLPLSTSDPGSGAFSLSRPLGDDGTFDVTVAVTDDDGGVGTATATVDVANLAPTVAVAGDTTNLPGGLGIFSTPGAASTITVDAGDSGSDDLTFTWPDGPAAVAFNDGVGPDPDPSPGPTFPFAAVDTRDLSFASIGVHPVLVVVTDDDDDTAGGLVVVLVTGTYQHQFGFGQWGNRLTGRKDDIPTADLDGMLDIITFGSSVFGAEADGLPLDTLDAAADVLDNPTADRRARLSQALLGAWLDVASGAVEWSDAVGNRGETVGSLIAAAEVVWWHPLASTREIDSARSSLMPI